MLKEAPQLLFTGLTREIGKPREYERNQQEAEEEKEEDSYFDKDIDISIPVQETEQWATLYPIPHSEDFSQIDDENQVQSYLNDSQSIDDQPMTDLNEGP